MEIDWSCGFCFFVPGLLGSLREALIKQYLLRFTDPASIKARDHEPFSIQMFYDNEHILTTHGSLKIESVIVISFLVRNIENRVRKKKCLPDIVQLTMQLPPFSNVSPLGFCETDAPSQHGMNRENNPGL